MADKKCVRCDLRFTKDDKIIQCDSCRVPIHLEGCSDLCASEARAVVVQKRVLIFFCDVCLSSFKKIPILLNKIGKLEDELLTLKDEVKKLKEVSAVSVDVHGIYNEVHERTVRASNVMLYNVPEPNSSLLHEKIAEDKDKVYGILNKAGLKADDIVKVVRVGPVGPKPRPVKTILKNPQLAIQALKFRNKIGSSSVKIGLDKTKLQQDQLRNAYAELKSRSDQGEADLLSMLKVFPLFRCKKNEGRITAGN